MTTYRTPREWSARRVTFNGKLATAVFHGDRRTTTIAGERGARAKAVGIVVLDERGSVVVGSSVSSVKCGEVASREAELYRLMGYPNACGFTVEVTE